MTPPPIMSISYEYKGKNNCVYSVQIIKNQTKIDILILDNNSKTNRKFKISLSLEELNKLNGHPKKYENIEEVYQYFAEIKNISELTSIELDKNLLKFRLIIPKDNSSKYIELIIKNEEMSENDILFSLCEKEKEIDELKKKNDLLFYLLDRTEKDFETYSGLKESFSTLTESSKIIKYDDLMVIQKGILKKSNKIIKDIKLIYRATKDGDSGNAFHSKCDNIPNTVTFIKAKNGKRFGGFTEKGWNSSCKWYIDNNSFLFSLDSKECYFFKGETCMYGCPNYGPEWGTGSDLFLDDKCLSNNNSCTRQTKNFEYNEKRDCLSGGENFQPEDYETYQLILE